MTPTNSSGAYLPISKPRIVFYNLHFGEEACLGPKPRIDFYNLIFGEEARLGPILSPWGRTEPDTLVTPPNPNPDHIPHVRGIFAHSKP